MKNTSEPDPAMRRGMKLFYSVNSPYARKCRIVVLEKGLENRVECIERMPLDNPIPPDLLAANPLGRVPALITDDGMALVESSVICDYLDSLANPRLIPSEGLPRYMVLGIAALTDGMLDAAVHCVLESRKAPERRSPDWIARKEESILRTLDLLSAHAPQKNAALSMATIGLGVALAYTGFRLPHLNWQSRYPQLAEWYGVFAARPSMLATQPAA